MSNSVVLPGRYALKYRGLYLSARTQRDGAPVWSPEVAIAMRFHSAQEANDHRNSLKPKGDIANRVLDDAAVVDLDTQV